MVGMGKVLALYGFVNDGQVLPDQHPLFRNQQVIGSIPIVGFTLSLSATTTYKRQAPKPAGA